MAGSCPRVNDVKNQRMLSVEGASSGTDEQTPVLGRHPGFRRENWSAPCFVVLPCSYVQSRRCRRLPSGMHSSPGSGTGDHRRKNNRLTRSLSRRTASILLPGPLIHLPFHPCHSPLLQRHHTRCARGEQPREARGRSLGSIHRR